MSDMDRALRLKYSHIIFETTTIHRDFTPLFQSCIYLKVFNWVFINTYGHEQNAKTIFFAQFMKHMK